tara:strand:+ start:2223 stop:2576 length:354 start_codon:yes stop_codon:yes gene_type:complete
MDYKKLSNNLDELLFCNNNEYYNKRFLKDYFEFSWNFAYNYISLENKKEILNNHKNNIIKYEYQKYGSQLITIPHDIISNNSFIYNMQKKIDKESEEFYKIETLYGKYYNSYMWMYR